MDEYRTTEDEGDDGKPIIICIRCRQPIGTNFDCTQCCLYMVEELGICPECGESLGRGRGCETCGMYAEEMLIESQHHDKKGDNV